MKTINLKSHIGSDGILNLTIPTEEKEVDVEVIVIVQPEHREKKSWPKNFFNSTYGSLKEDPLTRPPQGDLPDREHLI
jgi:hypothetical protein